VRLHRLTTAVGVLSAVGVLAVSALLAVPGVAAAQSGAPTAQVRIAHFSPDASYVDVYAVSLNRDQVFPNVFYKDVSAYWGVATGAFTYEVRPAGADPTAPARVVLARSLQAGGNYTVAAIGPKASLRGLLLRDDLTPVSPGRARVRFVDTLLGQRAVDVVSGGRALAKGLSLGTASSYGEVAPGRYRVQVRQAGGRPLYDSTLTLQAGTVTTAVLTGGRGQPNELFAIRDGAGVRQMPTASGGVATGAGGSAPTQPPGAPLWAGALLLTVVAVAGLRSRARIPAVLVATLLLGGCAARPGAAPEAPAPTAAAAAGTAVPAPRPPAAAPRARPRLEVSPFPTQVAVPGPPSRPEVLTIAAIGVETPLVPLALDREGALQVPRDSSKAGWFTGGPLPGEQGPAVIAGHVDSRDGAAVFYRLRELRPGAAVLVRRADGVTLGFTVERVRQYPKATLSKGAVFGPVSSHALRLITCAGTFDRQRRSYRDNLVVDARLTGFSRP
jgi:hypothetical protein